MVEFIKVIADLIQQEMDLPEADVFLYNQEITIPPVSRLFINVGILGKQFFGASLKHEDDPSDGGLMERQTINAQETYSVLVYSQDSSARIRNHEVLFALSGDAAQQASEKYSFKVGYLPKHLLDVSEGEGASRLNRYSLTFNILCAYEKTRRVEYFSNFSGSPKLVVNP